MWHRIPTEANHRDVREMTHKGDFPYFYSAAQAMTRGEDIYQARAPENGRVGYIHPPMIAFLYQSLTAMDEVSAARVSLLVNLLAVTGTLLLSARVMLERFGSQRTWTAVLRVAMAAMILSGDKIKGELQMLQTNALIVFCMVAVLWVARPAAMVDVEVSTLKAGHGGLVI